MTALVVVVVVAVGLLGVLTASLLRGQVRLVRRVEDLAAAVIPAGPAAPPRRSMVGSPAAALDGVDPAGTPVEVTWGAGRRDVVAFMTGSCSTCRPFWNGIAEGRRAPAGAGLVVVTPDPTTESRRGIAALTPAGLPVVMSSAAWTAYGVRGAPWFAVVVDGVVRAEGQAATWDDLGDLAARSLGA